MRFRYCEYRTISGDYYQLEFYVNKRMVAFTRAICRNTKYRLAVIMSEKGQEIEILEFRKHIIDDA